MKFRDQVAGDGVIDVQVPVAALSVPNNLALATIDPGADAEDLAFLLYDPRTGDYGQAFPILGSSSLGVQLTERSDGRWVLRGSGVPASNTSARTRSR